MSQERAATGTIQKWQKIITIVFVIVFSVASKPIKLSGQSSEYGLELNEKRGLLSNVSRTTITDNSGTVWVGTDAGLNCFPSYDQQKKNICKKMGQAQVWGLSILGTRIFVGSYDSGLYVFNLKSGKLIRRWSTDVMPRIRKIRKINQEIYIIHGKGISKVSSLKNILISCREFGLPNPKDFPLDVFTIHGKLNVCFYFTDSIFQKDQNGHWQGKNIIQLPKVKDNPKKILSGKEINGKTYLGLFINGYAVIDEYDHINYYFFQPNHIKFMAPWDLDGYKDDVYFSIGNNRNLKEGYFYKHKEISSKSNIHHIPINELHIRKYGWSVYVDTFYNGVWFNTLTHGVIFKPHRDKWIDVPEKFNQFKTTTNYLICWDFQKIQIFNIKKKKWHSIPIYRPLVDICEFGDDIFFIDDEYLYKYNPTDEKLKVIIKEYYNNLKVHQNKLLLFRFFGPLDCYDLALNKIRSNYNQNIDRIIKYTSNDSHLIVQQETKGYYLLKEDSFYLLKTNFKSDKSKNHFFLVGNILVRHIGNVLKFVYFDAKELSLKNLFEVDLNQLFPTTNIEWIIPFKDALFIGNNEIAFQFKIEAKDLKYQGQYYIGQSPSSDENIEISELGLFRKIRNQITCVPLESNNFLDDKAQIDHKLMGNHLNFKSLVARSWEGQTLYLRTHTNHYFYSEYGYLPIKIWNEDRILENQFVPVKKTYILDNFENGVYNLTVTHSKEIENILFKINLSLFFNVGFWFILIFAFVLVGFILLQSQREKLLLSQKIVNLQLNTLKANLNPHFVFNIMNLIQALIVKSEKNKALIATSELANLNRLFLSTTQHDLISLKEELEIINKYVRLEQMRYESDSQIDFHININSKIILTDWKIPPLILQPLVENAIKHGHLDENHKLKIGLTITIVEYNTLHINISNPQNTAFKRRSMGTNLGLSLVKDRLTLLNEQPHLGYTSSLQVYDNLNGNFIVSVTLNRLDSLS